MALEAQGALLPAADGPPAPAAADMARHAGKAAGFLKGMAHEGRLMILCHLATGEKSVSELEFLLRSRQAAVSQQLARLRLQGVVSCRREGKSIFYAVTDDRARRMVALLHAMFCAGDG